MSYYAQSTSSEATSVASSGQALRITWENNQYYNQPSMRTYISGLINQCTSAMSMESPPYYPYHAHVISGLHGSQSDNRNHYTFKIWAHKHVTEYDVNPQGHTFAEKFCFTYHYYEDNTYQRWVSPVGEVPSLTQPATASEWVWDTVHKQYRKFVNGVWEWAPVQ